jgi:hypothetical protein
MASTASGFEHGSSSVSGRSDGGKQRETRWFIYLALLTLAGAALRLVANRQSLAGDELILFGHVHLKSLGEMMSRVVNVEKTPPLGFLSSWVSRRFGSDPEWIRLPSLIAGTALVPAIAVLGRLAVGRLTGLMAGLLAVVNPILVFYSVEARSYALATLFVTLAAVFLLKARRSPTWPLWVGFGLCEALALMSHYVALAPLMVLVAWGWLVAPSCRRSILAAQLIPLATALAWAPWAVTQFGHAGSELERIGLLQGSKVETAVQIPVTLLAGAPTVGFAPGPFLVAAVLLGFGLLLAAVGLVIRVGRSGWRPRWTPELLLMVGLAIAAPLVMVIVSLQPDKSMLLARNALPSLPAILILVAAATSAAPRRMAAAAFVTLLASMSLATYESLTRYQRPQADALVAWATERWQPNTAILQFRSSGVSGPLGMMLGVHLTGGPRLSYRLVRFDQSFALVLSNAAAKNERIILVHQDQKSGTDPKYFDPFFPGMKRVSSHEWQGYTVLYATEYVRRRPA